VTAAARRYVSVDLWDWISGLFDWFGSEIWFWLLVLAVVLLVWWLAVPYFN
jgi:hypothetical protein